jgi:hypothetical protein
MCVLSIWDEFCARQTHRASKRRGLGISNVCSYYKYGLEDCTEREIFNEGAWANASSLVSTPKSFSATRRQNVLQDRAAVSLLKENLA